MRTGKVDVQFSSLGQVEIEVTAHVNTVVSESWVIALNIGYLLIYIAFMRIVHTGEIFHELSTTTDVDVSIIRSSYVLQQIVHPVHIGVAFSFCLIGRIAILVQTVLRQVVTPGFRLISQFTLNNLVTERKRIIRVHHIGQFRVGLQCRTGIDVDHCLALCTTFGGNQDYTVGTAYTIYSCRGSIFQDGEAFNIGRIKYIQVAFHTVNQH